MLNKEIFDRKQLQAHHHHHREFDKCFLSNPVPKEKYGNTNDVIVTLVQIHFKDSLMFYNFSTASPVLIKATLLSHGKSTNHSCISFHFDDDQIKYGLMRAIVKSK